MELRNSCKVSSQALACACGMLGFAPRLALAQVQPTTLPPSTAAAAQGTTGASTSDQQRAASASTPLTTQLNEVVVTAQKRQENIQNVGMSIQAASGNTLTRLGITDTTQLAKIIPGFTFTGGFGGAPVYSLRGVGFYDTSLQASPAVSLNEDEVPLPFSIEGAGSTLDLQRVEVLKGPQGTLFGENATGGAINYIAGKPTDHFDGGFDASYERFNTFDLQGYASGPVANNLEVRLALRTIQGDGWQQSQTRDATLGKQNFTSARLSALWKPVDHLRILAALSGFLDKSDTQAPQFYGVQPLDGFTALPSGFVNHPIAPHDNRAADWNNCVNDSPLDTHCVGYAKNNQFLKGVLRIDYDLPDDLTLTSLTSYQHFTYFNPFDGDGTQFNDYANVSRGHIDTTYQELRLSGKFAGRGDWIVGGNYENDDVLERDVTTLDQSSVGVDFGIPIVGSDLYAASHKYSYAGFVHGEYPILPNLTLNAGVRYTQTNISDVSAELDNGNGALAVLTQYIQNLLTTGNALTGAGVNVGPGGPVSLGPAPTYAPGYFAGNLNQNNVSWRVGLDYKLTPSVLVYGNVSQGYKSGSFPNLAATQQSQYTPVTQEGLLAYETGFKSELLNHTLQINGAGFYYDYSNKQIQGDSLDPIFGALPRLVNVPESHIVGFEVSGIWRPLDGLTVTPSLSYAHSNIDGNFSTFNYLGAIQNVTGERLPGTPEWQGDIDAQYEWKLRDSLNAFVGANVNYQGSFNSNFGNFSVLHVDDYTLLDLRAGLERDQWRLQFWGRNVTDQFYVNNKVHVVDAYVRYAGMPATYGVTLSYRFR